MALKMKYNNIFKNLDNDFKQTIASLLSYIQGAQAQVYSGQKDILTLIRQAKKIQKDRKKHKYPVLEKYLCLIENIIILIDDESLNKDIIDDYCLAQLYLVNFLSELIKMYINNSPLTSHKGIESINNFIELHYGKSYFEILDFISLNKNKNINNQTYSQLMDNLYDIIINLHPSKLEDTLNVYILKENNKLFIDNFEFKANTDLKILKSLLAKASKDLVVLDKMKKYEKITRYEIFLEFQNHNEYLDSVNSFLSKNKKLIFSSLNTEPEDISFLKEKIQFLISRGKKNEQNYNKLNEDLKKLKKENQFLIKNLENTYTGLAKFEIRTQRCKIIDTCNRFEEYFFNIINHSTQAEILSKTYSNTNENKIDLIVEAIEKQYPKYIENLKKNDIDLISVIKYVNEYRLYLHKNYNININNNMIQNQLITSLINYFKDEFNFKKIFEYMYKNFAELKEFIFDSDYRLNTNLYLFFCEKEKEAY